MSSKLVTYVWHAGYGDAGTILVLMALADEANDAGECSVNIPDLAVKARQSERNCRYLLRKLEELQIVERFEGRGRKHKNKYQLHIEHLKNLQPLQQLQVLENLQKVQPLQVMAIPSPQTPLP